ncbi:hypothetical protein FQN54_000266 [Arachnomyces sp. PD_36]|nr:hypothetical protein FQN54_000266 [Arachnomyces sp. PD_36]
MPDIHDRQHAFYNPSYGRWLYNEEKRLSERHLYFNVDKLCDLVSESVGESANNILRFTKIAEGGSYRVFDVLFKDQRNVIVRLPYPCTTPRKFGVASEVATMEYLRLHGLPIPKVLSWSSTTSNPLGCEYIIMEKARGKELDEIWYTMDSERRKSMVKKIVSLEALLLNLEFPASGSLYYKETLPESVNTVDLPDNDQFCMGPSTEFMWWYHKRDELQIERGPWKSTLDLLTATGERELKWLRNYGQPRYPREPLYKEIYGNKKVDPKEQILNLENYLRIALYVVPAQENWNKPTIRHPDLSPNNIFVDESDEITSIIDWERTAILPMFMQSKVPTHFQNFGDEASEKFNVPTLPENFESLPESEKAEEMELYRRRQLHYYYLGFSSRINQAHFRAMGTPALITRNQIYDAVNRPWEGDNTSLKAQLINLSVNWSSIITPPDIHKPENFPIKFTEAEIESCLAMDAEQKATDAQMQKFRDHFGCNIEGWVPSGMYQEAKQKVDDMKAYMLDIAETEEERKDVDENYPFQDHEELP